MNLIIWIDEKVKWYEVKVKRIWNISLDKMDAINIYERLCKEYEVEFIIWLDLINI
jgi:hypothetical protein